MDVLLVSLLDVINAQSDLLTGNIELKDVNEASLRFIKALDSKIDKRIDLNIEERKKFKKNSLRFADAPSPLSQSELINSDYVAEWFENYKTWYNSNRKVR